MSIAANASCTITESFTPLAAGLRQATLTFTDNAAGSPHVLALTGTGIASPTVAPSVRITPTTVSFPIITQGLASTPISVTITNAGNAPLHISSIVAGGNSPTDFVNSFSACSTATIAAGATCNLSLTFAPIFSGPRSETLSISDDAPNSPHVLNVFANAAAAFTLTSPSSALSASVTAGQTATYNLQLTPGTDFTGNVSFTCTGAPVGATRKVPSTVTLNIAAPASLTVTVPTSNGAVVAPDTTPRQWPQTPAPQYFVLIIFVWVCCALFASRKHAAQDQRDAIHSHRVDIIHSHRGDASHSHRTRWRAIYALAPLALLSSIIFSAEGCGGAASSTPAPHSSSVVTPRGTSTLVLTPTALSTSGKSLQLPPIQLTLTVN